MPEPSNPNPNTYRPGPDDAAIAKLRNPMKVRLFAAAEFTGARNSAATGLAQITANNNGFDIFRAAAAFQPQGQHPYNNWLDISAKPLFQFFPEAIGVYVGGMGDSATDDVGKILVETCQLTLQKQSQGVILRQPLLTVPPGVGVDSVITDSSGLGPFWRSRNGQLGTQGLFPIPKGVVFDKETALNAFLSTTANGATALAALAGNFPTEGAIIGVVMYGVGEFNIGAQR
ncbi:MAG: hypothetical protein WC969_15240 [Elusimicrobiota bacterium]|jgi:hypothetical protein